MNRRARWEKKLFFFVDDNITSSLAAAKEFFRALIPLKIRWVSQSSINAAHDDEFLDLLVRSGCQGVLIGFESLNPANLRDMNKTFNTMRGGFEKALANLRRHRIRVYGTFIFGYDGDTPESFTPTVEFAQEHALYIAAFNHLTPFPGTPLYRRLEQENDDSDYLGGARAWLVEAAMAVPSTTRHIADLGRFRRTVLLNLLRRSDLRLISVWHPSFLSLLLDTLAADWNELLAQLAHDDPAHASRLRSSHPNQPHTIWPKLSVVSCWADAHARGPAAELQRRLPNVTLQPKGLLATEACVTLPFQGMHPVAITSHFFEFLDDAGNVQPVEDLRRGESYEVVVTTGGGLWRYRLGDRVEVTGHLERTPTLRFLGLAGNVSDRCGEKLAETFVTQTLATLFPSAPFAMLAPEAAHFE